MVFMELSELGGWDLWDLWDPLELRFVAGLVRFKKILAVGNISLPSPRGVYYKRR